MSVRMRIVSQASVIAVCVALGIAIVVVPARVSALAPAASVSVVPSAYGQATGRIWVTASATVAQSSAVPPKNSKVRGTVIPSSPPSTPRVLQVKMMDWDCFDKTPSQTCLVDATITLPPEPEPDTPEAQARRSVEAVVLQASAELDLPAPDPKVGPDPSLNKWGIVAVGYPIWLWVEGPRDLETTVVHDGITITIKARLEGVQFNMGDGSKKYCTSWTKWYRHGEPPKESPTCGYRYQKLPKVEGAGYDLTAEARWKVDWTVNDHQGTLQARRAATRHLNVAEIQSVIKSRG